MTSTTDLGPLVKEILVAAPVERAWEVFTTGIDSWWPVATHSVEPEKVEEIVFEPRVGGRVFERWADGTESQWAVVEDWDPPSRLRMAWQPNPGVTETTEVEVTFEPADGGTRVRLEHRGWERLGDVAAEARANYDGGWVQVLARYRARV